MNERERFRETMTFGTPDRVPYWECAFWQETLERWKREGLPENVDHAEASLCDFFGFDRSFGVYFRQTIPINIDLEPPFRRELLSEEDGIITERGGDGVISRWSPTGHSTRQFVRFPVETRADFHELKPRLQPDSPGRFPLGWLESAKTRQSDGAPVCLRVGGYFGFARSLMGLENLSLAFFDQPTLIEEIFAYRTEYLTQLLETVLQQVQPDFAEFWEDMAYKTAPLVSPSLYRRLALKHYRSITDLLTKYGVNIILLDSDGRIDDLIPIWIDGGVTCVWPLEVAAGMDTLKLRQAYGRNLGLIGGIDKRVLAADQKTIRDEVLRVIPPLVETGGFIPTCDHAVPPDVPFSNYMYYLQLIREICC